MSIKAREVYEAHCDASGPNCRFATAYDSETQQIASDRAVKEDGWRRYGNRHKCEECQKTRTPLWNGSHVREAARG